jgi:lactoylglutathione lyase
MSMSLTSVGAVTLFVADPARSKAFYERVFGVPLLFEDADSAAFRFDNTIVNLLANRAAHELVGPAPVGRGDGARSQLTIWVDDADAACSELAARGVTLVNGPMDRAWGVRTALFADPDGHLWEIAQEIHGDGGS